MNILYCILHTQHQHSRANNILSTWGKNQNVIFYSDHDDPSINCFKVTDRSDYASGEIKQIEVFPLLQSQYSNYDWYFFCDNDTFVNTSKLEEFARTATTDDIHGDIINCWQPEPDLYYPAGGSGYLMSHKIFSQMTNLHHNNTQYSDVSIGMNFRTKQISVKDSVLFNGHPPDACQISIDNVKNYISFHYIKTLEQMQEILNNI